MNRGERSSAQRERILDATGRAFAEGDPSVARIVARAGIGRATFYELFDDAEHALENVRERILSRAARALDLAHAAPRSLVMDERRGARAPPLHASLHLLSQRWLEIARADPAGALAALDSELPGLSPLTELLHRALSPFVGGASSLGRRLPARSGSAAENALWFALVSAQSAAIRVARAALSESEPEVSAPGRETEDAARVEPDSRNPRDHDLDRLDFDPRMRDGSEDLATSLARALAAVLRIA